MATTVRQDNTHFDQSFAVDAGDVEREILTVVAQHRRSGHSTQEEKDTGKFH